MSTVLSATNTPGAPVKLAVPAKAEPFALTDVRLLDGPFKDAQERNRKYLHDLDADRLLHNFRVTAGLPSAATPYGGWEAPNCELRGHCVGHYLTACALMYASTGDEKLKAKADYIVAEWAKCQAAMPAKGYNKGFLSAYSESLFDRVDKCERVWAPYYTLHKLMAGLLDMYQLTGNQQALDVLVQMADWLKLRVDRLSHEQQQKALGNEHGGMNEVLANLYAVTGNPDHLKLARAFNHEAILDPLARGEDQLNGKHANTQVPKLIGAAREYELTGEPQFKDMAQNFWKFVALNRSYCIGGHSDGEHFFPVTDFAKHLSTDTAETCNTYNMLKLTRHLFAWEPSAATMDFYERALYNHILASQDPQQGMFVYLMSLKPGHFKTYSTPDNSFWCCVGTGIENHSKYADTIFMHGADTLYVNLFIPAELTWKEKGLVVRQETAFPASDTIRLRFQCAKPVKLTVKVRRPAWAGDVAGKVGADGYLTYERVWRDGDTLDVRLPMTVRTETLPGVPNIVALLYGPVVLAGELGTAGMPSSYSRSQTALNHVPSPEVPVFVCAAKDLPAHVVPVAGKPLTFQTKDVGRPVDVTLIPFYQLHHQRYSVYWRLCTEAEWAKRAAELAAAEARRKAFEARIVDEIHPGAQQSETDHNFKGDKTRTGYDHDRSWRDTRTWISYEVKVLPDEPMTLRCTYWSSDGGNRVFDILVDGEKVAEQKLNKNKPDKFFDVDYTIPAALTKGKQRVTVKFQAHSDAAAGGLFGLVVLKPE